MSDLKGEIPDQRGQDERFSSALSASQRRRGLFAAGGLAAAGVLAVTLSLPSGHEVKPDFEQSFKDEDIALYKGKIIIEKGVNIRTSEKISKSDPNTVDWDSIVTENGALKEVNAFVITNAVITLGDNPDGNLPDEANRPGEWINFTNNQGQWLKISFSDKTAGFVHGDGEGGKRISGHPNSDGGFISDDNSTMINPKDIAVVELVRNDQ